MRPRRARHQPNGTIAEKVLLRVFLFLCAAVWPFGQIRAASGSGAQLQAWFNVANQWGGTVQPSNSKYTEGDAVPLRFTASLAPGTQHTVLLKYDFSSGGTQRFFDSLASFNATIKSAALDLTAGMAGLGTPTTWTMPADISLPAGAQLAGVLTTYNVSSVSFGAYTVVSGVKTLPLTFTVAGTGSTAKPILIGYGGHLATEIVWGAGNGASQFPGASRKAYASLDGAAAQNVSVNPGAVVSSADLAVTGSASPEPVNLGGQLTYQLAIQNLGPDAATNVVLQNTFPTGLSFVSATSSQGTFSGSSVSTFSLGTLPAGASANISIVALVSTSKLGLGTNTATVSSPLPDPNSTNNTAAIVSTIVDTMPPVISCPAAITQPADPGVCGGKVTFTVTATDNSGSAVVTCNPPSGSIFPGGTTTVQCKATDPSGNTTTCSFSVTVIDNQPPTIIPPPALVVSTDPGQCQASKVALGTPVTSDNCSVASVVSNAPAVFPKGTTVVTWTVTDTSGNQNTATQTVTVNDNEKPSITAPPAVVVSTDQGQCQASKVALGTPVTSDNCGVATVVSNAPAVFPKGVTLVTWTVTDTSGNQNMATQIVTVNDNEKPSITAPSAVVVSTDPGRCQASKVALGTPVTSDNCAVASVTNDAPAIFSKGMTLVTWTVTDTSGNQSTATQTVTVNDTEPPKINCPANIVAEFGAGGCSVASAFGCPTAVDNCDGFVPVVCNPPATALLPLGTNVVTCTSTDSAGNTSTCVFTVTVLDSSNQSWPLAMDLGLQDPANTGIQTAALQQCVTIFDQSRWFKFKVQPGSRVVVTVTDLPENYDLVLFKDIAAAYQQITSTDDLLHLSASFASDAFSPGAFAQDAFSPGAFAPGAFAPGAFAPGAFAPGAFAPGAFAPGAFAPGAFAPDAYAPGAFAPGAFAPGAFAPGAFAPGAFAPGAFAPGAFAPGAFAGAQLSSVLAVSALDGVANEGIIVDTWDNSGDFYVRVKGRNGVFSPDKPFTLNIAQLTGACGSISPVPVNVAGQPLAAVAGGFKTIILTDPNRWLPADAAAQAAAQAKLESLAAAVNGVVVDVGADPVVSFFNLQADAHFDCPYAKNLVANSIKDIIDRYRALNPLEYVVLVGNDSVIPFFRYPDEALLGPERNYVPPVKDLTASQASLRLDYLLSQDAYGANCDLALNTVNIPLPDLAVGRLAETPAQVGTLIDVFLAANGILTPAVSLVTGYDFLADDAQAVESELAASLGANAADQLISPNTLAPSLCWTANDLRALLFGRRHDLIFLAGHFSAVGALAADYTTGILASEFQNSTTDFRNALIFSAGCHSGYNIVDADAIPYVTLEPDWVQACASKGATLVAGTGYQYGDTDFIEYGERLYLGFAQQLRTGSGPIAVGKALLRAKRTYVETTPALRPIHIKTYLQATLFGLPMSAVDLPGPRRTPTLAGSVAVVQPVTQDPGTTLGLQYADVSVTPNLVPTQVTLTDSQQGSNVVATYLAGGDGVVNNPVEPILPLEVRNVAADALVLRGVGFRSGAYTDLSAVLPLTGAAVTEIRGVHANFISEVFYPVRPWNLNYFGALCGSESQNTRLMVIPAQFKSDSSTAETGTLREFTSMNFRLFYSANVSTYTYSDGSTATPASAAPPTLSGIQGTTGPAGDTVALSVHAVGDPSAGMQTVWVTYTALSGPNQGLWQSIDLTQNTQDSTLWTGQLPLNGTPSQDIRFIVQAVNGVGTVALDTRLGAYYYPDEFDTGSTAQLAPTSVTLLAAQAQGAYGTQASFTARLTDSGGNPLAGMRMVFSLGDQELWATTDAQGTAKVVLSLLSQPGNYDLKASFPGSSGLAPSFATTQFSLSRQGTSLGIAPKTVYVKPGADTKIVATLADSAGNLMFERTVFFVVVGPADYAAPVITDANGRAALGPVPLGAGVYTVTAYFNGAIPLPGGTVNVDDGDYLPSSTEGALNVVTLVVDDQPPQIICPADLIIPAQPELCTAVATYAPTVSDDYPGATFECSPPSGLTFPRGTNLVTCVATDLAGNTNACVFNVIVVDTQPPAMAVVVGTNAPVACPGNISVPADPNKPTAMVPISVTATDNCPDPVNVSVNTVSGSNFPIGTTLVNCVAADISGNATTCSFTVTVNDTQPPNILLLSAYPSVLSPPNHQMVPVTITVSASDNSGGSVASSITGVASSEPQNGLGDGDQYPDWEITGPLTLNLRAERAQNGPGRIYTITVQSQDASGNVATGTVTVFVPKSSS